MTSINLVYSIQFCGYTLIQRMSMYTIYTWKCSPSQMIILISRDPASPATGPGTTSSTARLSAAAASLPSFLAGHRLYIAVQCPSDLSSSGASVCLAGRTSGRRSERAFRQRRTSTGGRGVWRRRGGWLGGAAAPPMGVGVEARWDLPGRLPSSLEGGRQIIHHLDLRAVEVQQ